MNTNIKPILIACGVLSMMLLSSCLGDLDRYPVNDDTSRNVYATKEGVKQALAKIYGAYALTGNSGPAGYGDIQGIDEGESDFLRNFWNCQTLTTEEAICAWSDVGLPDLHNMSWSSSNTYIKGVYYRSIFQIKLVNEFLLQTKDKESITPEIPAFRAEARFIRAFQYWVLMDLFANPPFIDETMPTGKFMPKQIKRADLFKFIEQELKDIEADLKDPRTNEYGRADRAAAWALMARIYLNAEVYTGTARYSDAAAYAEKVINSGYKLMEHYEWLFMADSDIDNSETILSINYDGTKSQNWGGTTFLINSAFNSKSSINYGMSTGGWGGNRATSALTDLFDKDADARYLFEGSTPEIQKTNDFEQGMHVYKFRNIKRDKQPGSNGTFSDVDYPLFRLAEMYLIYAEAALRGGGDQTKGLEYFNIVRNRAYNKGISGYVKSINLQLVLDERAREFYWEGLRRTDLIRYNMFTEATYVWPWKGGVKDGKGMPDYLKIFPIPADDIQANPSNLKQNLNY